MNSDIKDILLHLASEAIFAILLILTEYIRYFFILKRKFNNTNFKIYRKGVNDKIERVAKCKVRWDWAHSSPKIIYSGIDLMFNNQEFAGEFYINPINLKTGTGFHLHDQYDGYNFPKIMIKNKSTFYIETEYVTATENDHHYFEQKFQAWVWKKY